MKVIQLIQKPQLRGAEIFACQLSNHLQKDYKVGVDVIAIYPGNAKMPFEGRVTELNRPIARRFFDYAGWRELASMIESKKIDVVQANASDTLKFAAFSKMIFGWKARIVFRNANKIGDFIDSKLKYLINRFFINNVDYVVSVSRLCEVDFKKTFNYPAAKITNIPIGVDIREIPAHPPDDLKDIFEQHKVLVNVGSLVPEKNHEGLLRIFNRIADQDREVFLLVIGDGALRAKLEDQASTSKYSSRIRFLGYRNDVLQVLKHAQAFLMPSFIEGLPGVILEAMYCRTPVVANNVGGISEVIGSSTGWLIEPHQENNFIAAVKEALEASDTKAAKVEQAYRLVREKYMNEHVAQSFANVYMNLVSV